MVQNTDITKCCGTTEALITDGVKHSKATLKDSLAVYHMTKHILIMLSIKCSLMFTQKS